jgi:hypothetical protein
VRGAAPAVTLAEIVTLGGPAFAGAAPASITRTTTLAARSTHRPYSLILTTNACDLGGVRL